MEKAIVRLYRDELEVFERINEHHYPEQILGVEEAEDEEGLLCYNVEICYTDTNQLVRWILDLQREDRLNQIYSLTKAPQQP